MARNDMTAPEMAAIEVRGHTRAAFIARGAVAAAAAYGAGAANPFVSRALAAGTDVDILNFALTLEYLESAFYERALKQVKGLSGSVKRLATEIRDNEAEHVKALTTAIRGAGGKPVKAPKVDFGGAFASEATFLALAQTLEDTGVSAYNGAAPLIKSGALLGAAGSIVQIEARHASLIRLERGESPAPDAFDPSLDMKQVLAAVKPFVKGGAG